MAASHAAQASGMLTGNDPFAKSANSPAAVVSSSVATIAQAAKRWKGSAGSIRRSRYAAATSVDTADADAHDCQSGRRETLIHTNSSDLADSAAVGEN